MDVIDGGTLSKKMGSSLPHDVVSSADEAGFNLALAHPSTIDKFTTVLTPVASDDSANDLVAIRDRDLQFSSLTETHFRQRLQQAEQRCNELLAVFPATIEIKMLFYLHSAEAVFYSDILKAFTKVDN